MTQHDVENIARDPRWLAQRYDPGHDAIHFLWVPREAHRRATFLTDLHLKPERPAVVIRRAEAMAAAKQIVPLHFVFHSAFCCSTLIARAFDHPGWSMGLKEPVILNDIVGWRRRGATAVQFRPVLDNVLTLLSRPFGQGETVVVKPSNVVNGLAVGMMDLRPDARALAIHASLRDFLASIVKKGLDGRLFVRELFLNQLKDGMVRLGFDQDQLFGQTDLQIAAAGWLVQQQLFQAMGARYGPERVRIVASDTLLANPHRSIEAMARLYGMTDDRAIIDSVATGAAFSTHSKDGSAFGAEARAAEYAAATLHHADEVHKVLAWAHSVAEQAGIAMDGKPALLD